MSQSGYTPISLYTSTTTTNVPLAGNLVNGELAINITDGKLFYKDNTGAVQIIASKAGNINVSSISFGSTGLTPSTATTGAVTVAGTLITSNGGTGLASYTAGDLPYYASGTALSKLGIGTSGKVLTSSGTAPQWTTLSGVAVTTFQTSLSGLTPSTATSGAVTLAGTLGVASGGTGLSTLTAGYIPYGNGTSALGSSANLTFNGTTLTASNLSTTGVLQFSTNASQAAGSIAKNASYGLSYYGITGSVYDQAFLNSAGSLAFGIPTGTTGLTVISDASISGLTVGKGGGAVSTNAVLGLSALASGSNTGSDQVAIGRLALNANTSGAYNVSVGSSTLTANTTGSNNTAIGYGTLYTNSTGGSNTAIGSGALQFNTTASNNTAVGYQSQYSNTTGSTNDSFGYAALYGTTTGAFNVGIGAVSLYTNSTGSYNTAVGREALRLSTTASYNTAVGYSAGYSNTTGVYLTALGAQALQTNSTGSDNNAFGRNVLLANTTGYSNSAFGGAGAYVAAALVNNTTGFNNSAFGNGALASNTTNSQNTAVGYTALYNSTGGGNTAIGSQSLFSNTTANFNTALGYLSLFSNTTASGNTAVGYQAGYSQTTGSLQTYIGYQAGYTRNSVSDGTGTTFLGAYAGKFTTTGADNTFIGAQAGYSNTTGGVSVAVGAGALQLNTTGSSNTAHGYAALFSNTTASNNTAVGYQAGYSNTTGGVTALGYQAGYSNTSGTFNTFIGNSAGYSYNASGATANTFLGYRAGYSTTGYGNTFVGAGFGGSGAGEAITTGSKNTIIGAYNGNQGGLDIRTASNYIVLSDGDGNPRQVIDSSGNLGLGVTSPVAKLHVKTTSNAEYPSGYTSGSNFLLSTGDGGANNVYARIIGGIYTQVNSANLDLLAAGNDYGYGIGWRFTSLATASGAGASRDLVFNQISTSATPTLVATEIMRLTQAGNLGLGVTPSAWATYKAMQVGWSSLAGYAGTDTAIFCNAYFDGGYKYIGTGFASQYRQINSSHQWFTAPSGTAGNTITFTQAMTLDASGNLLVGTTSNPSSFRLVVSGGASSIGASFTKGAANQYGVQIGNTTATYTNYVDQDNTGTNSWSIYDTTNSQSIIRYYPGASGYWQLYTNNGERMRIDSSGNLLVGMTSAVGYAPGFVFGPTLGGTSAPAAFIGHASGASTATPFMGFGYNSTAIGSITQSGTTAVLYNTTSDQRLKENIVDAPSGNIDDIKVRSFDWIADGSHQTYGMVAQELVEVAPYAVHQPQDTEEMMAVDYSKLVPMMIKEIQDLKARIAQLEAKS